MAASSNKYFPTQNGRIKVQFETIMNGANPPKGWVYETGSTGNNPGFQGNGYYFWKSEKVRDYDRYPSQGLVQAKIYVDEPGNYNLRVRSARDIDNPGDARNDVWMKVDGSTDRAVPSSFNELVSKNGFAKLYKAQSEWGFADRLGTRTHNDRNPDAEVMLDKGFHTVTFAGRSNGLHMDYFEVYKGGDPSVNAANTKVVGGTTPPINPNPPQQKPEPKPESKPDPKPEPDKGGTPDPKPGNNTNDDVTKAAIKGAANDWESNKGAPSSDLEFGRDGSTKQSVGLRFSGLDVEKGADIKSAYFIFEAAENSKGRAKFEIEIENTKSAARYTRANDPDDRKYIGPDVDWNVESWKDGKSYKSPDISKLIEAIVRNGDLDAQDTLAFRISGSGGRAAEAFEGNGDAPVLVINYDA